jgi:hypothetical protein
MNRLVAHITCGAILISISLHAQTGKPAANSGPLKAPSKMVNAHRHESGMEITLPASWMAEDNQQGTILLPPGGAINTGSDENQEFYVAQMVDDYDPLEEESSIEKLSTAFVLSGAPMRRAGEREALQIRDRNVSVYTWEFTDPETATDLAVRFYIIPDQNRAFLLVAAGEMQRVYGKDSVLREAAASMTYRSSEVSDASMAANEVKTTPEAKPPQALKTGGPLADNTPIAQQWLQKLRGRVIRQFIGGGGVSGERSSYLAPDGTYTMRGSASMAVDVGGYGEAPDASASSVSRNTMSGRWYIRDRNGEPHLQITLNNGQILLLAITWDNRNWYLDGVKSFAVDP